MSNDKTTLLKQQIDTSFLFGGSAAYLEEQYELYLHDPNSVSIEWKKHFDSLPKVNNSTLGDVSHAAIREHFTELARHPVMTMSADACSIEQVQKQAHVLQLINAYRHQGHRLANLDPLGLREFPIIPALQLSHYNLSSSDLSTEFETNSLSVAMKPRATLSAIIDTLKQIYCGSIGFEYMYINDSVQTDWTQHYIESAYGKLNLTKDEKKTILKKLTETEGLERYLGTRYVGQKRFSVEGGDSFIPLMNELVCHSASHGVQEVVIGMAHRGRLNLLVNIMGKAPEKLFAEFEGKYEKSDLSDDVKYHKGYSSNVSTPNGIVHLALGFNPSHLEIISPVVEGSVKARQIRRQDAHGTQVVPVVVHGDAAFSGQGVVMETFALSQAKGYSTGGTVHIVINNQIGFTTTHKLDEYKNSYSTDIAKMVQAPIIHVNADDPEAVVFAARLALDFRMQFQKDVVIDLVCYRRFGHNESDEPSMTQPIMYQKIKAHPTVLTLYTQKLVDEGVVTTEEAAKFATEYRDDLEKGHPVVKLSAEHRDVFITDWTPYWGKPWNTPVKTSLPKDQLIALGERITYIPDDFVLQPQVAKEYEARRNMLTGKIPLHWGMAESLAYASLVDEEFPVRLAGQDSGRGTFSHRHAVLHDVRNDKTYEPLAHVSDDQATFTVLDTILSEEAVLAFEYGYASAEPKTLVIWEAQFGDFMNGAQVMIDQFITSGEQKWGRLCGLSMFLPHGYEGMGPEHSSARLERFLQACAQDNIQVLVPTTPAQCFHMIRRQMLRPYRKPMIVMTPKSLLRHRLAISSLDDLAKGEFMTVIPEVEKIADKDVQRLIFCSGKVYYDLVQQRTKLNLKDTAIVRIEQLYPFPTDAVKAEFVRYSKAKKIVWCQDEPENQGSWRFCRDYLTPMLSNTQTLLYAGRPSAAAPAVGSAVTHAEQQEVLINAAFK